MSKAPKANAVVGQSGGPTGVINESLVGVIEEASKHTEIENLYGAVHAVAGMVEEHFIDLKKLSRETVELTACSPASALGSSRDKPDAEYCEKIFNVFRKWDIQYFFYIGGNDSANTAHIINQMAADSKYELRCFHIPKTVDNDLVLTDHCPGYGTAAKYVACGLMGDDLDNRALPGVKVDVLMGRHAGFLTGASVLGRRSEDCGPHLVYLPEKPITMDKLIEDVDNVYREYGRCVVAASEGICDTDGETWAKKLAKQAERDAHGNVQLSGTGALADYLAAQIKGRLEIKRVRADTFGYLQRCFPCVRSEVDAFEARQCGRKAVEMAMSGDIDGSVSIRRVGSGKDYSVELFRSELHDISNKTKSMPDEFINLEGNGVTDAFVDYAMPLVGELPETCYLGNYPRV